MNFHLHSINQQQVKVLPVIHPKPDQIKGWDTIPKLYANIFICGKKGSGKTNVLNTILQNCIDKKTEVIVFCATHNFDPNWKHIKEWLKKRKQPCQFYEEIFLGSGKHITSHLEELTSQLRIEKEAEMQKEKEKLQSSNVIYKPSLLIIDAVPLQEEADKANKKPKKIAPDKIVIFDDMSGDLRTKKDVAEFLKHMRHYKTKVIISSQYPKDIDPAARMQLDFWLLFAGFPIDKLKEVYAFFDIPNMPIEDFYKLYQEVTHGEHQFLYVDKGGINTELRKNLNLKISFPTKN